MGSGAAVDRPSPPGVQLWHLRGNPCEAENSPRQHQMNSTRNPSACVGSSVIQPGSCSKPSGQMLSDSFSPASWRQRHHHRGRRPIQWSHRRWFLVHPSLTGADSPAHKPAKTQGGTLGFRRRRLRGTIDTKSGVSSVQWVVEVASSAPSKSSVKKNIISHLVNAILS